MRFKLAFSLLMLFSALTAVVGCSSPPTSSDSEAAVVELGPDSNVSEFQILIVSNDMEIGEPRIPFIIRDGPNMAQAISQVLLTVIDINQEPYTTVWEGAAINYSDYTVPYWVFYPQIEKAGNYGIQADILLENGETSEAQFAVAIQGDSIAPAVGDPGFPSESRTAFDLETAAEISSDFQNPDLELYKLTVAEALSNGRPTVISFSTPSFCATAFCAPVLETVKEAKAQYSKEIDFLHVEIFADFEELKSHQTITEWELQSEPWTYVLDASGIVSARFGGPVSLIELTTQLESMP